MKKLAILAALLFTPAIASATASTTTYSSSTGRWIATCPPVASSAACTLDCTHSPVQLACADSDGCAWTLAETHSYFDVLAGRTTISAFKSNDVCVVEVMTATGANTFADSAGVQETNGDATITVPLYGSLEFIYGSSRWSAVDATGADLTLGTGSVSATEIADITRAVPLPLGSWVPCAGTVPGVWDATGADTEPDMIALVSGAVVIQYDDTGGSVDADTICNTFIVPADYVSGGAVEARVIQDAATTNIETWSCNASLDGAALVGVNAANLTSSAAVQTVTSTPVVTYVAGKAVSLVCSQGNASADDIVYILGTRWTYTASQ